MTFWRRTALGAAAGALLVLLFHPLSRPFYRCSFLQFGDSRFLVHSALLPANSRPVPMPDTLESAAYWMVIAADQESTSHGLSRVDRENLVRVCHWYGSQDPDNSFWRQVEAAFLWKLGRHAESNSLWIKASRAQSWNDLQNARLITLADGLRDELGSRLSWSYAYSYYQRSSSLPLLILRHALIVRDHSNLLSTSGLRLRYATLRNGALMRDGARSNGIGRFGMDIIELAAQPTNFTITSSRRRLLEFRGRFHDALMQAGMIDEASGAFRAYGENEAWLAFTQEPMTNRTRSLAMESLAAATFPGSAIALSLFGCVLALFGYGLQRFPKLQALFRVPLAPLAGVVLAVAVYWATQLGFASIWPALCLSFFAFSPHRVRSRPPSDLGVPFQIAIGLLATALMVFLFAFLIGASAPGIRLMPLLGVPMEFTSGSTLILSLAGIVSGLILLLAPTYGMMQKIAPSQVAAITLRKIGVTIASSSLVLAVLFGPIAVAYDRYLRTQLEMVLKNEPNPYLREQ